MHIAHEKWTFDNGRGQELAARLEHPSHPSAYALFAHCFTCSKDIAAASRISRALCRHGYGVLRFDFTGLGNSDGDFANTNFSSNIEDLIAAANAMRGRLQAPQLLVGHSLGGAAVLAASGKIEECRAVATIGAPSSPQHILHLLRSDLSTIEEDGSAEIELGGRLFTIRKQFLQDLSSHNMSERLKHLDRALLIFHSPIDNVVGIEEAAKIYQAARHPKSFISLDKADHLLRRAEDSRYVASVLSAWALRYVKGHQEDPSPPLPGFLSVEEEGEKYTQIIRAKEHLLTADEPRSVGGQDLGPDPYSFLLAALGACTSITLRMYADHKKWPLEHVRVNLKHSKIHARDCHDCRTQDGKIDLIERRLELQGPLDEVQRKRLLEIADRCPVHRTLESENKIRTTLLD